MERDLTQRSRYAACVTYCRADLVERRLQELVKGGVVRFYALIDHDRDVVTVDDVQQLKQRHCHVVINTTLPLRHKAFENLFAHCDQIDGKDQNTLVNVITQEYLSDRVRYLCHLDDPDKYQYSLDLVRTNDDRALAKAMQSFLPKPNEDFMQMLSDVLVMSMAQFAQAYGRDGVLNYGKYRSFALDARQQQLGFQSLDPVVSELATDAFNQYELYSLLESNAPDSDKMLALWKVFNQKTQYFYSSTRKGLISLERSTKQ